MIKIKRKIFLEAMIQSLKGVMEGRGRPREQGKEAGFR